MKSLLVFCGVAIIFSLFSLPAIGLESNELFDDWRLDVKGPHPRRGIVFTWCAHGSSHCISIFHGIRTLFRHSFAHDVSSDTSQPNDHRFSSSKIGMGAEFRVAVITCASSHPELPIYLFTNVPTYDEDLRPLIHRAYFVDLMEESGLGTVRQRVR